MNEVEKRKLFQTIGIAVVVVVVFSVAKVVAWRGNVDAMWPEIHGGVYASAVTVDGRTSLIPGDELYETGVLDGGIPALTSPKYASVLASDAVIADDLFGIDLALDGEHRFYPVQVLNWHEVVNDHWGGQDIAVTYCPLCGYGAVYSRNVGEETLTFRANGQVYNNNVILQDDETGSLWVQGLGLAVEGEHLGTTLTEIPSTMMRWSTWKALYPDGLVLSTNTGFVRDYTRHPYSNYDTSEGLYYPTNAADSTAFTPKWMVTTVSDGTNGLAFADTVLSGVGLNASMLGEMHVIAVYDFTDKVTRVFDVGDMTFTYDFAKKRLTDVETGSVWNAEGMATSGALKGTYLTEIPSHRMFYACVLGLHPTWTAVTTTSPQE